jgi:multiple antibiotic resistance protein
MNLSEMSRSRMFISLIRSFSHLFFSSLTANSAVTACSSSKTSLSPIVAVLKVRPKQVRLKDDEPHSALYLYPVFPYNEGMKETIQLFANTFIPLFVAMNVFSLVSVFISLTQEMSKKEKRPIIKDSILTAVVVSLVFIALGGVIFSILGITADDFRIAGGLILLVFAILDLTVGREARKLRDQRLGVVPIGVPLTVGPAVLTTLLVLVDNYGIVPTLIALFINLSIAWLSLANAEKVIAFFGKGGIIGLSKVMALLLASIAVMMIRLGLVNIIRSTTIE